MKKHVLLSQGIGRGLVALIFLISLFGVFFLSPGPVQATPVIFPGSLPNGQVGTPYTATLVAASTVGAYTWTVTGGSLPPLLTLNAATGVISGNPTTPGTFSFIVTITDTTGPSSPQGFFITITQLPLRFLDTSLLSAKVSEAYTDTIRVSGGTTPYTWSLSSGSLPSGLTLDAGTGYISGIPDKGSNGNYGFMVQVTDSSATPLTGQQSFSITVEKGGYDATITISSGLKAGQTKVSTAGGIVATLRGGESTTLSLDLGIIRAISVDSIVVNPTDEKVRYKVEETAITVSESSPDANFTYHTEYYIAIKVDPTKAGQLSGSGWYKEDYALRTSATPEVTDANNQSIQYRFAYWQLPTGETTTGKDLSLTVTAAGTCTAYYDTYYKLSIASPYGNAAEDQWYKAGSEAEWEMTKPQVQMEGFLGIFGGKLKAVNPSGTTIMDSPKTITIEWQPDYTMPFIMIPLTIVLAILAGYGIYLLVRSSQPKPLPAPPPYYPYMPPPQPQQPIQPPQTTVVMIGGDKPKLGPGTTREQLMEKFGELLQKYEDEIKTTTPQLPGAQTVGIDKRLPAPGAIPPAAAEAAASPEEETATCNFTSKRALRVVVSNWRQVETRTAKLPKADKKTTEDTPGIAITWARDIFQEWEILSCWLPRGHKEPHEGSVEIVYSRMNTVNEEKVYAPGQELEPPAPHYTDGMPQVDITAREVVAPEKLPPETAS
ncbi:MAG: Ig domain-containing protein [Dehalococcoidia bacterium]|nr:Ig domain-containing protein [Dehalococcoidia bacterium]